MQTDSVSLVIFTCQGREHLLAGTIRSFRQNCDFKFDKTILAIDGPVDPEIIDQVNPDIVIQHHQRSGYVNSILKCLKIIDTPFFFWLEDDWMFNKPIDIAPLINEMRKNADWVEIVYSKYGPLPDDFKIHPLNNNLYQTVFGFSANPSICNTEHLQWAFNQLLYAQKGINFKEDGFEDFLSKTFEQKRLKSVILDPVDHVPISHEGYLESTPREWHMTGSIDLKKPPVVLYIPTPSAFRRLTMTFKLAVALLVLSYKQLLSDRAYELSFRIVALSKRLNKK